MRALIIDDVAKQNITTVIKFAEDNPFTMDRMIAVLIKQAKCAGDIENHVCIIPMGYRCVYSIEQQKRGDMRHLSVSISSEIDGAAPSPEAVQMIMQAFGFKGTLLDNNTFTHIEDTGNGHNAISILELI